MRLGGGRRRRDVVPSATQVRLQRTQELRLVVDDEHALAGQVGTSTGSSTAGSASTNDAPWPGRDSTQSRPPFASAKPRAIARPRPGPRRSGPPGHAVERLEDSLALLLRDPRPVIGDADEELLPRRADTHVDGLARRRDLERVLEHVHECALDLDGVDARLAADRAGCSTCTRSDVGQLLECLRRRARPRSRAPGSSSAAPASSRERSSRFSTSRLRRRVLHADRLEQLLSILVRRARERRSRARRGPARSSRAASAGRARPPGSAPS